MAVSGSEVEPILTVASALALKLAVSPEAQPEKPPAHVLVPPLHVTVCAEAGIDETRATPKVANRTTRRSEVGDFMEFAFLLNRGVWTKFGLKRLFTEIVEVGLISVFAQYWGSEEGLNLRESITVKQIAQ